MTPLKLLIYPRTNESFRQGGRTPKILIRNKSEDSLLTHRHAAFPKFLISHSPRQKNEVALIKVLSWLLVRCFLSSGERSYRILSEVRSRLA